MNVPHKHRGIVLAYGRIRGSGQIRYRIRDGRDVAFATSQGLTREWRDVYVRWLRAGGETEHARRLAWREVHS